MIRRPPAPSLTALSLAGAAGAAVLLGLGNPVRSLLVLSFLVAGPGLALVPLMHLDGWSGLTLAAGLSLALDALVSAIMIYPNVWSPTATLAVLVLVTPIRPTTVVLTTTLLPGSLPVEVASRAPVRGCCPLP